MPGNSQKSTIWLNLAFTALSDTLKREIVQIISLEPGISVNELCARVPVSRFTIMRNLNSLEEAELLHRKRVGKTKQLYVNHAQFARLSAGWLKKFSKKP